MSDEGKKPESPPKKPRKLPKVLPTGTGRKLRERKAPKRRKKTQK